MGNWEESKFGIIFLTLVWTQIIVPRASMGVADFEFATLCTEARGSADYLMIARAFHTVIVRNVPKFNRDLLPELRRFITMVPKLSNSLHRFQSLHSHTFPIYQIDVFDYHLVKVILSSHSPLPALVDTDGMGTMDEAFAFNRTISRLQQMQSKVWLPSFFSCHLLPVLIPTSL